jgi:hypothetical protein
MMSIGWFLLAWLVVSLVVSVVLGQLLRHNSAAVDQEADDVVNRKKVVRYMRQHKIVKYENHTDVAPSTSTAKSKAGNGP